MHDAKINSKSWLRAFSQWLTGFIILVFIKVISRRNQTFLKWSCYNFFWSDLRILALCTRDL